jgi:hypothetical protein
MVGWFKKNVAVHGTIHHHCFDILVESEERGFDEKECKSCEEQVKITI